MVVGFVVKPGGPLGEMSHQRVAGNFEASDQSPHALLFACIDRRGQNIGNEISVPGRNVSYFVALSRAAEITFVAGEAFAKNKRAVENKFLVAVQVHNDGRGCYREKLDRFASAIDKPVPTVKRWGEQTPAIPLKSMLLLALLPDLCRAISL